MSTTVRSNCVLGLVKPDEPYVWQEIKAMPGDLGELISEDDPIYTQEVKEMGIPDGWQVVKFGDLYAPVHPSMIEAV